MCVGEGRNEMVVNALWCICACPSTLTFPSANIVGNWRRDAWVGIEGARNMPCICAKESVATFLFKSGLNIVRERQEINHVITLGVVIVMARREIIGSAMGWHDGVEIDEVISM
jgi:hypothetical protein